MMIFYFIGLDIHKKLIAFCIKALDGRLIEQGTIDANRKSLVEWVNGLPCPWIGAMEATIFTGCIYDFLRPSAVELKVAHPEQGDHCRAEEKRPRRHRAFFFNSAISSGLAVPLFTPSIKNRSVSSRSCR